MELWSPWWNPAMWAIYFVTTFWIVFMIGHTIWYRTKMRRLERVDEGKKVTDLLEHTKEVLKEPLSKLLMADDANDMLLIEDSSDGNAKRSVRLSELPTVEEARNNGYINSAYRTALGPMDSDYSGPSRGGTEPVEPQIQQMPKADEPRRKLTRKVKEGERDATTDQPSD